MIMDYASPWDGLKTHFRYEQARSQAQLEQIFRIRYDVYCREFGFEREEDCPGQMEQDAYDASARHCLLRHTASGEAAGCVRVILPATAGDAARKLPIERFCGDSLFDSPLHPARLPRNEMCEISRLAVPALFRRRMGEMHSPVGEPQPGPFEQDAMRTFPLIGVSMFIAAAALAKLAGRRHIFAMMEPKLARLLSKCGIHFQQIGQLTDYHGARAAFYLDRLSAEHEADEALHALYNHIIDTFTSADREGSVPSQPVRKHAARCR